MKTIKKFIDNNMIYFLIAIILLFLYLSFLFYDNVFFQYHNLSDGSLLKISKITKTIYLKPYFMDKYIFSIDKNRIVYLILEDFEPTPLYDQSIPLYLRLQYSRIAPLIWKKVNY